MDHINFFFSYVKVTHWHSPYFHGYFAPGSSYPSILGDMLSDAIGCIGFSWVCIFCISSSSSIFITCIINVREYRRAIKNGQYKIGICCFSVNQTALRRKSKDWLAWNQDNVSE